MSRQFFSGNSIEQAIMAAARHHSIEPEKVAYSVRDKKHGFLNIRRRVVIEVDPQKPKLTDEELASRADVMETSPTAKPTVLEVPPEITPEEREDLAGPAEDADDDSDEAEDRDDDLEEDDDQDDDDRDQDQDEDQDEEVRRSEPVSRGDRGGQKAGKKGGKKGRDRRDGRDRGRGRDDESEDGDVREFRGVAVDWKQEVELEGVTREMAAFEFAVEQVLDVMDLEIEYTIVEGETFKIEFSGEDADLLTEDDGRVLKAFEHVLPRVVRGLVGESLNCKVDCEGFRAEHEDQLVEMAQDAADEVRDSGDSKVLPQMNPSDRRIIHLALVNDPDVETVSQGRGYMKRVRVQMVDEA